MARLTSLALERWTARDRMRWIEAFRPAPRFRAGGAVANMKGVTQSDYERRYGYYLEFLNRAGLLDPASGAAELVSVENFAAFLDYVKPFWSSVTIAEASFKVLRVATILAPEVDFTWLRDTAKLLRAESRPRERSVLPGADELIEAGLTLMEEALAAEHLSAYRRAIRMRTGLMMAVAAAHPFRAKNLRQLTLGQTMAFDGKLWWIDLTASDTKERRPDVRELNSEIRPYFETYLTVHRPVLLERKHAPANHAVSNPRMPATSHSTDWRSYEGPLWINQVGTRMTGSGVHSTLAKATYQVFGVAVNPHAFRSAAATTSAWHAASSPGLAAGVLNHTDSRVTRQHYIRANNFAAMETLQRTLRQMMHRR